MLGSQRAVAQKLRVHPSQVTRYLRGTQNPSSVVRTRLHRLYRYYDSRRALQFVAKLEMQSGDTQYMRSAYFRPSEYDERLAEFTQKVAGSPVKAYTIKVRSYIFGRTSKNPGVERRGSSFDDILA